MVINKKEMLRRLLLSGIFLLVLSGAEASSIIRLDRTEAQKEIDERYSGKENFFYHPGVIWQDIINADLIIKATVVSDLSNVLPPPPPKWSLLSHKEVCFAVSAVAKGIVTDATITVDVKIASLPFPGTNKNWVLANEENSEGLKAKRDQLARALRENRRRFEEGAISRNEFLRTEEKLELERKRYPSSVAYTNVERLAHTTINTGREYVLFLQSVSDDKYQIGGNGSGFYPVENLARIYESLELSYSQHIDGSQSLEFRNVDGSKVKRTTCKSEKEDVGGLDSELEGKSSESLSELGEESDESEEDLGRAVSDAVSKERALMEKKLLSQTLYAYAGDLIEYEIKYEIPENELSEIVGSEEELPRIILGMGFEVSRAIRECHNENRKSWFDAYLRSLWIIKRALLAADISNELRSLVLELEDKRPVDLCSYSDKVVKFTQS